MGEQLTEEIWDFVQDPEAMKSIEWAARSAARKFEHVEYDDAYQDAVLYVAERAWLYQRAEASGDYRQFGQDVYSAIRKRAVEESNRRARTVYTDAYDWDLEDDDE